METSNAEFLGRADAEANLGLAYLMSDNEETGIRWLHHAQQRFEATHNREGLQQCLENQAEYFANSGRSEDANRLRQKVRELEAKSSR